MEDAGHNDCKIKQTYGQLIGRCACRHAEHETGRRILRISEKGAGVAEHSTHRLARAEVLVPLSLSIALNNLATTHGEVCSLSVMTATAKGRSTQIENCRKKAGNTVQHGLRP